MSIDNPREQGHLPGLPSYISTDQPRLASAKATKQPTGPAPTTTAFFGTLKSAVVVRCVAFSPFIRLKKSQYQISTCNGVIW